MKNKTFGKPEPDSDVLNRHPKTLLVGYGWVGQFVHKYFTEADIWTPRRGLLLKKPFKLDPEDDGYAEFEPYRKDGAASLKKGYNGAEQDERWQVAFISTPTPMAEDGSCDTSMVEAAVERWHEHVDLFIIRSTVAPGTTKRLAEKYNTQVVMQPEYVGETLGHPLVEPNRQTFIILGGSTKQATRKAAEAWASVLHAGSTIRQTEALTAEYCKYMENCYLATKVIFANDWARLCRATGVDYLELREAWLDDPRIERTHTMAYEKNPGFSGKCLPKDLNAIAHYARAQGEPLRLVEALIDINAEMRAKTPGKTKLKPQT